MQNFIQKGDIQDVVASATWISGQLVQVNATTGLHGACVTDIANGATGAVRVKGVVEVPCLSTDTPAHGAKLYWDTTNVRLTTTAGALLLAGVCARTKISGETTALLDLNVRLT